jgi:hypothetical protein
MSRSSSHDPHRALGYFDLPSRSAPSSPQTLYIPYSPVSRSSSPARDVRRSREFNFLHTSGSDIEDALTGFSLVPNWLKMAMEQDQHPNQSAGAQNTVTRRPYKYSPLNSPGSVVSSSNDVSPITPRTPQLNVVISQNEESTKEKSNEQEQQTEDDAYWAEDEGYFGELEDEDEDLEEIYRSVR